MDDLIGQHLGPYRILEQIGTGGMATVYKAYQPAMDRYVAVKVIASHFAQDQTFLQRFRREARAVARLEHAHVLPVYDSGEAEGHPYLVMRYLEAGTLKDRIAQGDLPLREVNRIIGQVGSALDYAHRMGVIHRDVKPTNVLLDAEGDAFLTDFGLARMVEASVQLTGTGVGIGTPAYMSPEQGKGAKVNARADVYSLGVMLYEMVTGRPPYEAETPLAVVLKHITEPLPLPRSIRPDLPEEVEWVILRALAKEPGDRFPTVGEMVQALDAAVRAPEAATGVRAAPPAGRRRMAWAVVGAGGEELWSYRITTQAGAPVNADVVDVDDDGVLDVVGTGKGDSTSPGMAVICAMDRGGVTKWQAQGDHEEAVDLAYGDVDGDGDTDVVASVGAYPWGGGQVILLDGATGTRVWSQSLGSGHAQGIDARDVDGDGDMEIAVENYDNRVFLLDGATGSVLWSRPKGYHGRDVVIEDVDNDGTYEIVSAVANATSYDPDGNPEWATSQGGDFVSADDVNDDGQTEVIFSSVFVGDLHVVAGSTGEELWSRTRSGVHAVGDVDGDGVDDVVAGTIRLYGIEPPYSVDAVDGSNSLLWSYPLDAIYNDLGFGLAMANLDGDPALEVLVANGTELLALDVGPAGHKVSGLRSNGR